ncbi:cell division protein SepF [Spongiactinospora sp. TRM90649]|uniref:cell division protein SepF n=1 Tax=Spongiactinospora sp. TRM90649 TaxID=3031114 RepID=UPI0023F96AA5|nr:cell division protein SepF [Spongiactinospora sp. TRM90649]MDF5755990.1 cell division protein SepF [Spongiactinospora sp. TRM90649]
MIRKLRPATYGEALHVGHYFRAGDPVVMDLNALPDEEARQLVDFAAGLICGRGGEMNRVCPKVFLLLPA